MHDIFDLGLELDGLTNEDAMVEGNVASSLIVVVKVDQRTRDVFLTLLEIANLP
jgi:hypothetical protein